jgi:HK97 family phage prohead protease
MSKIIRRVSAPSASINKFASLVGDRQVLAVVSSEEIDRVGDVVVQSGIDYSAFMRLGGVVLWQHDADYPVARTLRMGIVDGNLQALTQFPALGTSSQSDECYRLIREGVVTGTSIGFMARSWEPLDREKPYAGVKYTSTELVEFSYVSVPANRDAAIIAKGWRRGSARTAERPAPAPSVFSYAGTAAMRQAAFSHDHPDRSEAARLECQVRAVQHVGYDGTARGAREYAAALRRLLQR